MKATAMLCDFAQLSSDGKLTVIGAGITRIATLVAEPPLVLNFALAALVEVPWDQTNRPHRLHIELVFDGNEGGAQKIPLPNTNPADEGSFVAEFNAGRGPEMVPGESSLLPIALPFFGIALPAPGGYSFKLTVGNDELAHVPFQARIINQFGFRAA